MQPDLNGLIVYDYGTREHYVLTSPEPLTNGDKLFQDEWGESYVRSVRLKNRNEHFFSLFHSQKGLTKTLVSEEKITLSGSTIYTLGEFIEEGQFLGFYNFGFGRVAVRGVGDNEFQNFDVSSRDRTTQIIQWPRGELSSRTYQQLTPDLREITLVSRGGERKTLKFDVAGDDHRELHEVDLANGRRILVYEHQFESHVFKLSFLDFYDGTVVTVPINQPFLEKFLKIYENSEGRILGLYRDENENIKTLQLYGPLLLKRGAP